MIAALAATHARAFAGTRGWSAAEFSSLLAGPGVHLIGDAKSFVLGRVTLDEAEILTLATDPAWQRHGLARKVLQQFGTLAKRHGAATLFLEVAADNAPALALYRHEGFVEVGQRPHYYATQTGTRIGALVLRKVL